MGNWDYKNQPALKFTILNQNPQIFPYRQFLLKKIAVYNGGQLFDPLPFNKGALANPDSINYSWSDDFGTRNGVRKKVEGHRIP